MKKKKEKIKGRAAAVLCMVLMILLAVPAGTCVSLSRERRQAQEAYVGSGTVFGLLGDLSACQGEALNLVTLGKKYFPAEDDRLRRVEEAAFEVESAPSPRGKAAAFRALYEAAEALYEALGETELQAEDERYRVEIFADFAACTDMMYRRAEDYNEEAEKFNAVLENAPGRALAKRFGIRELELFE